MNTTHCPHCGWTLQGFDAGHPDHVEFFNRPDPLVHCINCDKLPFMSDDGHFATGACLPEGFC